MLQQPKSSSHPMKKNQIIRPLCYTLLTTCHSSPATCQIKRSHPNTAEHNGRTLPVMHGRGSFQKKTKEACLVFSSFNFLTPSNSESKETSSSNTSFPSPSTRRHSRSLDWIGKKKGKIIRTRARKEEKKKKRKKKKKKEK